MTVWGNRVSPVFDAARTLLIAEIENNALVGSAHLVFDPEHPQELARLLLNQQAMILICGAISEGPAIVLESAGLTLIPFITGDVRNVLDQYLQAQPFGAEFRMPGCGKRICCRRKIRRGRVIGDINSPQQPGRGGDGQMFMKERIAANDGSGNLPDIAGEVSSTPPYPAENGSEQRR